MSTLTEDTAEDLAALADGKGLLCIMDETGDTRIMWDPNVPSEVEVARKAFKAAKANKMVAYKVNAETGDKTAEVIKTFDPTMGKIIMAPALVGG